MKAKAVCATEKDVVELQEFESDEGGLTPNQVLVKTAYSLVSPGTELDCVSGKESSWFHFPQQLGYCAVGEVAAVGSAVSEYGPGDIVLAATAHATHGVVDADYVRSKVPAGVDAKIAPFVHIALISITALRRSAAELGDCVAVVGQGLIGNLAAQLFRAQGSRVIALDRLARRLEMAKKCGVELVVNAADTDPVEAVRELTGGRGVEVVVEATGSAAAALQAVGMAAQNGEMILLGTPRGSHAADVVPLLRAVHRASPNLTLKGAHGGSLPPAEGQFVKHSAARNARLIFDMVARKQLVLEPLISRVARPEDAPEVYRALRDEPEKLLGVVFDWRS